MSTQELSTRSYAPTERGSANSPRLGATPSEDGTTQFALWSTRAARAAVRIFNPTGRTARTLPLVCRGDGLFSAIVEEVGPGALYKFELDGLEVPDPYARFLPQGVHGPARVEASRVGGPRSNHVPREPCILYEIHLGTFTPEGTFRAAQTKLEHIAALGVTAIELMPISAFRGSRGWGYDGVAHFAPHADYGEPDDVRAFIDKAHDLGLGVILDVVYNHFGPDGNYLSTYATEYFDKKAKTSWGDAPNFGQVRMREYVLENARYWLEGFGFDGLRLDATHGIIDKTSPHILEEIAAVAHSLEPPRLIFAEDDRNDPRLVTDYKIDGLWADDFHHALRVLLTNEQDGYYAAYKGRTADLARVIERGWLYEGQVNPVTGASRGSPATGLGATSFVYCIQNHDQVGNRAMGDRLNHDVPADLYAAASMLLLFLPMTPLLFMGQEWGATTPFLYFTDHEPALGALISRGRREEFKGFASFEDSHARAAIPDPQSEATFTRSKLNWTERETKEARHLLDLYRQMIALRKHDLVLSVPSRENLQCRLLGESGLVVRRSCGSNVRSLFINFGKSGCDVECSASAPRLIESRHNALHGRSLGPMSAVVLSE